MTPFCQTISVVISPKGEKAPPAFAATTIFIQAKQIKGLFPLATAITIGGVSFDGSANINLPGVNQVQIDEKTGMDFPKALKAFLRQDPDIILVGEIRDITTGGIAVKAAQTGHMVMSTLHTNDGPQTLTRLQDMGVQSFAVATSINLITAQRLLRRLNPDNRVEIEMPDDALRKEDFPEEMIKAGMQLYGPGEETEDNPGYKGRAGIYQVMPLSLIHI